MTTTTKICMVVFFSTAAIVTTGVIARAQTNTPVNSIDSQVIPAIGTQPDASAQSAATTPCSVRHQERLEEMAKLFNMPTENLQKELDNGKPMYQIAAEHNVTYSKMAESRLSEMKTRLDNMVKVGYMTQAEADQIYSQMQSQPNLGMGLGRGHGMRWFK